MDLATRERAEHSTSGKEVRETELQNLDSQLQQRCISDESEDKNWQETSFISDSTNSKRKSRSDTKDHHFGIHVKRLVGNTSSTAPFNNVSFPNPFDERQNFLEIEITNEGTDCVFAVGICPKAQPSDVMPGWIEGSYGYHADGNIFIERGDVPIKGPRCGKGDHMGCGLDFSTMEEGYVQVWFTKNHRLACLPEKISIQSNMSLYPLVSVGTSGEVMQHHTYEEQGIPDKTTMYPWYVIAGFSDDSNVPFSSSEVSLSKYGPWPEDEQAPSLAPDSTYSMPWNKLCDTLLNNLPELFKVLGDKSPPSYDEWLEIAEQNIKDNRKFADSVEAPSGTQFQRHEHTALLLAKEFLATLNDLNCSLNLKQIAILAYLSLGMQSQYLNISVVGGLLYMGCSANSSHKHRHVLHNPDISVSIVHLLLNWGGNPNCADAIGRTPLHIHQNNKDLMRAILAHNADVNALDDDGDTPLHYAGVHGRIGTADLLIEHGAVPNVSFRGRPTSLDVMASSDNFDCFKQMLKLSLKRVMEKKVQQQIIEDKWKDAVSDLPKYKKVKLKEIEALTNEEFYCVSVKQHESDDKKYSLKKLVSVAKSNNIDLKPEIFTAIFDRCLYGQAAVTADILDADINGDVDPHSSSANEGTSLFTYLRDKPKLLLPLVRHETLKAYISDQWQKKALLIFWMRLLFHLFQLILLTFALAIAARPGLTDADINAYSSPIDYFRGVCEATMIIIMLAKTIDELIELFIVGISSYIMDITNYVQWFSIILILLIVPLRIINHPGQWIVASLLYTEYGLKLIYFAGLFHATGGYIQALAIVVLKDIGKFMAMFLVVLVLFGGTFYFSLRYGMSPTAAAVGNITGLDQENAEHGDDNSSQEQSGLLYLSDVYVAGLRTMIESSAVLDYYSQDAGLDALSTIWYLILFFIVVTVLLNVLIGQISDTYTKVIEKAETYTLYYQCLYMARLEEQNYNVCMTHPVNQFLRKCRPCVRLFRTCYRYTCCKKRDSIDHVTKFQPTERPKILWTGKKQEISSLQVQNIKRKLQQIFINFLSGKLDEKDAGNVDSAEDEYVELEHKVDFTQQHVKEMKDNFNTLLQNQQIRLSEMLLNSHSSLVSKMSEKKRKIETDVHLSEELKEIMLKRFLSRFADFQSEMSLQLDQLKLMKARGQAEVQDKLARMVQDHKHTKEQLTMQQEEMKQRVSRLQEELQAQKKKQGETLSRVMHDQEVELHSEMLNQQTKIKDLSKQLQQTREFVSHMQSELDAKLTEHQDKVRVHLVEKGKELKENLSSCEERLTEMINTQQKQLKSVSLEQERVRDLFQSQHDDLDVQLSGQQKVVQQLLAEKQRNLITKISNQKEEMLKLALNEMAAMREDFQSFITDMIER